MGSIISHDEYQRWAVDLVIETISNEALYGFWDYPGNMHAGLIKSRKGLHKDFNVHYAYEELFAVVDMLKQMLTVWKSLTKNPDVMINKSTKTMLAKPSAWERLVKADERVKWYAYEGEKASTDLEVIFENPWKGKDEFIHLGEVSGLHKVRARFDEVELEPFPVAPVQQSGRAYSDDLSPTCPVANDVVNYETFSPNPAGTLGLHIITKEDYEKFLSSKISKNAKRLFFAPNSPLSSAGSSYQPLESTLQKLKDKFDSGG